MKKKSLLVIFPDEWLSHSPTVLNLVTCLSDVFEIRVITIDDGCFNNSELKDDRYTFIKINSFLARNFLRRVKLFYHYFKTVLILLSVRKLNQQSVIDIVIGIDSHGLWIGQTIFQKAHFLSLEIEKDVFFRLLNKDHIESVAIQTKERADYLFRPSLSNTFFLPNSPIINKCTLISHSNRKYNKKIVLMGNLTPDHGLFQCIDAIELNSNSDLSLTLKGFVYNSNVRTKLLSQYDHLFKQNRLILDEYYTPQKDVTKFLSEFSIGFCLYDFSRISKDDFNYASCPSGKLYNYFAAGLAVIGTNILGLKAVREFKAGILLTNLSIESIHNAIEAIGNSFQQYHENAFKAAEVYDFKQAVRPYKNFLLSKTN